MWLCFICILLTENDFRDFKQYKRRQNDNFDFINLQCIRNSNNLWVIGFCKQIDTPKTQ